MAVENWTAARFDAIAAFRRDLHANPEILYETRRTAARVAEALRAAGCDEVLEGVGRTGVVGIIRGRDGGAGRSIGLRADMDALPILEESGAPWSSSIPGAMHACGHDGHTAMLLGAAQELASSRAFDGTVVVIFQPAEEGGNGADAMIRDGLFERAPVDEVYGLHNRPNVPLGTFLVRPGPTMAAVDEFTIRLTGVGGHAAQPHRCVDPVPVMAALIQGAQTIVSRTLDPLKSAVLSITSIHCGEAFNVIPQTVDMKGTVRTLDAEVRADVEARLRRCAKGIAEAFGIVAEIDYAHGTPPTVNDPTCAGFAADAAAAVTGETRVDRDAPPTMGGEDFSFMLEAKPGAIVFAGTGPGPGLHHPSYDFNDDLIPYGCSYWTTLVRQRLGAT